MTRWKNRKSHTKKGFQYGIYFGIFNNSIEYLKILGDKLMRV